MASGVNRSLVGIQNTIRLQTPNQVTGYAPKAPLQTSSFQRSLKEAVSSTLWPYLRSLDHVLDSPDIHTGNIMSIQMETIARSLPQDQSSPVIHRRLAEKRIDKDRVRGASPTSILEASNSFRPETYTISEATPRLFRPKDSRYPARQEYVSDFARVYQYGIFYSKLPSQWVRLTISVTIGADSPYWAFEKTSRVSHVLSQHCYGLPTSLILDWFLSWRVIQTLNRTAT